MLKGKNILITGTARGIGRAVALKLAEMGANIAINYRSESEVVESLKEEIESKSVKAIKAKGDVSDFNQAKEVIDTVKAELGSIDVVINNAGITKDALMVRMTEEEFDKVIDVNLKGTFNITKHVAKIMMKQRSGRIINISSVSGLMGNVGQVNYSASKAGVVGLTKSAARELAPRGITVNAVAPGFIDTDMTKVLSDDVKNAMLNNIPLKKFGHTDDIANIVGFLASDMAGYITGQVISVDGGMAM